MPKSYSYLDGVYKQKHDKPYELDVKMFDGQEFNSIMASIGKKRLWVTYQDGGHFFKVEWLPTGGLLYKGHSLGGAVRCFNEEPSVQMIEYSKELKV